MDKIEGSPNIINLCWHQVTCLLPDGKYYHWKAAAKGTVARVQFKKKTDPDGKFSMTAISINLPEKKPGIEYIVSRQCLQAAHKLYPNRDDLLAPGEQSPDVNQKVKYCIGWLRRID